MSYLDGIHSPQDLKKLNDKEMSVLAGEIRDELLETVSQTGGHLASNLGVVELTLALHRTFSLPEDKIVWDVGHQAYVHKMLTGRREKMKTIRQKGGISGFPSPEESPYDAFATGHSSTSLSAALGLCEARDLMGGKEHIVAVIGDGAFTGGMAFEALNQIAHEEKKIIMILNDNAMSISENVGGMSRYLNRLRTNAKYIQSKNDVAKKLRKTKRGSRVLRKLSRMKDLIKYIAYPGMVFEEWGVTYLGPINGHDIKALSQVLERAKGMDEPVLIHVATKKGKGYSFAEENPEKYHGVAPFDLETGEAPGKGESFSSRFGETLIKLADEDQRVVAVTPSMAAGSGLVPFSLAFPDRFFDVGIAEGHAVTFSGALSQGGLVPVCSVYSSFLQRAYDSVIHDVALTGRHVVFAIDRAGAVAGDGKTHQGVFDLAFLSHIPHMTVLSPCTLEEEEAMLRYAVIEHQGSIAIRYPRGDAPEILGLGEFSPFRAAVLREGSDAVIFAEGIMTAQALFAAERLQNEGISCGVLYLRSIKPFDAPAVEQAAKAAKVAVTIENGTVVGGMGEHIAAHLAQRGIHTPIRICGFPDEFLPHETVEEMMEDYGLTGERIASIIKEALS